MKNQTLLTSHDFVISPHPSTSPSTSTSASPSQALSVATSRALSAVQSCTPSPVPYRVQLHVLSVSPSQNATPSPPSSCNPSPVELHESRSGLDSNDNNMSLSYEDSLDKDSTHQVHLSLEEKDMNLFTDVGGAEPKAGKDIRGWQELREQIKLDLLKAHKLHDPISCINQLILLRNFATLHLKGVGCIAASQAIARQWQDGEGVHFTHQIRYSACHYQLFKQILANK